MTIVVGAGIGGLCAAIALAGAGIETTVIEKAAAPGGKMRRVDCGGAMIDAGPTVLTMRWVFSELFESVGARLADRVAMTRLDVLARHTWGDGVIFDLFADVPHTADAIGRIFGAREARGYLAFSEEARRMYTTLRGTFLEAKRPNPVSLALRVGPHRIGEMLAIRPFDTMWRALGAHFSEPRLRQLFGRYATYCGSSPFDAPATLMLIAHVEQEGVWSVEGGMHALALALETLARSLGVAFRYSAPVEAIDIDAGRVRGVRLAGGETVAARQVVFNGDPSAIAAGALGEDCRRAVSIGGARSLSAVTWCVKARARGFPLSRHNVFFSNDYRSEFAALFGDARLPESPTIYVCAQDRPQRDRAPDSERLLVLINAPPIEARLPTKDIDVCETSTFARLRECGLEATNETPPVRTGPADFERLYPGTNGALYGRATHGWAAAFRRPGSRTPIAGLYLAGGGAHPGAGAPMAALSGRLAAASVIEDLASTRTFPRAAISGGTSTR